MQMSELKAFFSGKRVTVMGLGLLGRGVGSAIFLAECGARLTVTDLKSRRELQPSLMKLRRFKGIRYVLGGHRLEDFSAAGGRVRPDFILKAAGVPLDSPFVAEARRSGIPIEMDASLFMKLAPAGVKIIGVTGTRGKTTTTLLIYGILKKAFGSRRVFLGGNIKDVATLPLLQKVRSGDFVVLELDSWQLEGLGEARLSPPFAVFTTFYPDHMNYYHGSIERYFEDKAAIFRFQRAGDILVVGEQAAERVRRARPPAPLIVARPDLVPSAWRLKIIGRHNRANTACAVAAARALHVSNTVIKKAVESFRGAPGRLELIRVIRGVKIYNDTCATTPDATIAALKALKCSGPKISLGSKHQNSRGIILILGGSDKGLNMSELVTEITRYCKAVVLLPGSGTEKIENLKVKTQTEDQKSKVVEAASLKAAVKQAIKLTGRGDTVLFSPAFASFGLPPGGFKNEYDRGEQFVKIVSRL